jgi:hypothetical protein
MKTSALPSAAGGVPESEREHVGEATRPVALPGAVVGVVDVDGGDRAGTP